MDVDQVPGLPRVCEENCDGTASKARKMKGGKSCETEKSKKDKRLEKLKLFAEYCTAISVIISTVHMAITYAPGIVQATMKLLKTLYLIAS